MNLELSKIMIVLGCFILKANASQGESIRDEVHPPYLKRIVPEKIYNWGADILFVYKNPEEEKNKFFSYKAKRLFLMYNNKRIQPDKIISWKKFYHYESLYNGYIVITAFDYGFISNYGQEISEKTKFHPHTYLTEWFQNLNKSDVFLEKGQVERLNGRSYMVYRGYNSDKTKWLKVTARREQINIENI